jgi:hypothetical protein
MHTDSDQNERSSRPGLRVKGLKSTILNAESIEIESTGLLIVALVLAAIVAVSGLVHWWH